MSIDSYESFYILHDVIDMVGTIRVSGVIALRRNAQWFNIKIGTDLISHSFDNRIATAF